MCVLKTRIFQIETFLGEQANSLVQFCFNQYVAHTTEEIVADLCQHAYI